MRAAWFDEFGAARDVLEVSELDTPSPAAGEVLVRIATSGVNPSDVKKRAGSFPDLLDGGFVIPNSDGAGIIEAVGDGVDAGRIGERVWIYQAQFARRFGTAAEYVALYPNILFGVHRDHAFAIHLDPVDVGTTVERVELFYTREDVTGEDWASLRGRNAAAWRAVFGEDVFVVEGMQQGRHAKSFDGGRFSPAMDEATHCFHSWVAKRFSEA